MQQFFRQWISCGLLVVFLISLQGCLIEEGVLGSHQHGSAESHHHSTEDSHHSQKADHHNESSPEWCCTALLTLPKRDTHFFLKHVIEYRWLSQVFTLSFIALRENNTSVPDFFLFNPPPNSRNRDKFAISTLLHAPPSIPV